MRRMTVLFLTAILALAACSRPATSSTPTLLPAQTSAPPPPPQGSHVVAGLDQSFAPALNLTAQEVEELLVRNLSQGEGSAAQRLADLYRSWGLSSADPARLREADVDGDGVNEVVTVLTVVDEMGQIFVISLQEGRLAVDRTNEKGLRYLSLVDIADMTGDGRQRIAWMSLDRGAHTTNGTVVVSQWAPGQIQRLPGTMAISFPEVEREGQDLLLTGGTVASAGAGLAQRRRTDRYRWVDGAFRLVDRQFAPSEGGYHRLQDGIVAEQMGRLDDARLAFREAAQGDRLAFVEGKLQSVAPEWADPLGEAVHAFAAFRLGLIAPEAPSVQTGRYASVAAIQGDRAGRCQAAAQWAEASPEFLRALNSPFGYANPEWTATDLCGPLPGFS